MTDGRPPGKPIAVYLDTNHWYDLGKVLAGRSDDDTDKALLSRLRQLVEEKKIFLPLSAIHYMELRENPRDRLTSEAADAMEQLSDFWALSPSAVVLAEEIDEQLQIRFGRPDVIRKSPRFGRGFGFAHGEPGQFVLTGPPEAQAALRRRLGDDGIQALQERASALFERAALAESRNVPDFNVYADRDAAEEHLREVQRFVENLRRDASLRARLGDAILARELASEILRSFSDAIQYAAVGVDKYELARKVTEDRAVLSDIVTAMPSRRVAMAIRTAYFGNLEHRWKVSDLRDIEALALAMPSCDVVVTDNAVCSALRRAFLGERGFATVLSRRRELLDHLDRSAGSHSADRLDISGGEECE